MDKKVKDNFWNERRVLITGGAGFLGAWIIKKLVEKDAHVTALIRDHDKNSNLYIMGLHNKINIVWGKLEDYPLILRALNEHETETIFHIAAQAIVTTALRIPLQTFESNIRGTYNILEAVRHSEMVKRTIIASSDKAYGTHNKLPYSEEAQLIGEFPYDVSKSCADLIAQSYFKTYGLPIGITRCGNFYGGGDLNFDRIVPGTIKSLIFNKNPIIRSDGTFLRDYFYIEDAANAYITLAENLDRKDIVGQAFNFGTGKSTSVLDIVNKIIQISGKTHLKPIILNTVKSEIKEQYLDCSKAKGLLNWTVKSDLEKNLKKTYQWYEEFFNRK